MDKAILCILSCVLVPSTLGKRLVQTNLIWRHGDRSSGYTYPNDPYQHFWKNGPYQLTEKGMAQAYDLGIFLRGKYGHMLSDFYRKDEIYIKSTELDRTKMTAQCVIAGLYSPNGYHTWNSKNTPWVPFPLDITETSRDWLVQIQQDPEKDCPKSDILIADIHKSSESFQTLSAKYSTFFDRVQKFTGSKTPFSIFNIINVFDNINCLRENGHLLPDWADDSIIQELDLLSGISMGVRFVDIEGVYAKTLSKLRNGIILENMIGNMKRRIQQDTTYSLIGYSAHDSTLTALLISLGAFNWLVPPYSSCVMIDLYEDDGNEYFVEFWYRNDSSMDPYPLRFYDCGHKCSFDKFVSVASTVMTDETTPMRCDILKRTNTDYHYLVYILFASLILYLAISRRRHYFRQW